MGTKYGTNELPKYCTKEYSYLIRVINMSEWKGEHYARWNNSRIPTVTGCLLDCVSST